MTAPSKTTDLLAELELELSQLEPSAMPAAIGELARVQAVLTARMVAGEGRSESREEDHLLGVEEASERLGTTSDWLYRHASELPFTVRLGPQQLRFSSVGITKFIRAHQLRQT